jgi:hypothetical protein
MKLDRFEIKNFRSIEDIKINIEEKNGKKMSNLSRQKRGWKK